MEHSPPLGQPPRILLSGGGGPARFKLSPFEIITLAVIMLVGAFIGYNAYAKATNLNKVAPAANTYLPAFRQTLVSTVSSTGTVAATDQVSLSFDIGQGTGRIQKMLVGLGDKVTVGQPLAKLDDSDLQKTLTSAQSNLNAAQARLSAVLNPTATNSAQADQTVASAQNLLQTAQNNLNKLLNPTPSDVISAQQTVASSQSQLQSAQANLTKGQNQLSIDQNALISAQSDLATAQASAGNTTSQVRFAFSNLQQAVTAINLSSSGCFYLAPAFVQGQIAPTAAPLPYTCSLTAVNQSSGSPSNTGSFGNGSGSTTASTISNAQLITTLGQQITAYNGAIGSYNTAIAAITSKQVTVANAQTALTNDQNNIPTLQSAVQSAQVALQAGQAKLQALLNPQQQDVDSANASLNSAQASLKSAQTSQNALFNPTPDQVAPLQATVDQATANVTTAQKNLDAATIFSPCNCQVSQVNDQEGQLISATSVVFIVLDPNAIRVDANVDQVDINNLKVGQTATITFDALQGRAYQGTITAIGLTPTIQQGVVTYNVTFSVDTSRLAPGVPVPAPGMTAALSVLTSQTNNALVVPNRAIRRLGARTTITVKNAQGQDEQRTVTTGATNGTLTQITSGLNDGEEVLISSTATARSNGPLPGGVQVPPAAR